MPIQLLDDRFSWLAEHSGFSMLSGSLKANGCLNSVTRPREGNFARVAGKLYSMWRRFPPRDQTASASEFEFFSKMIFSRSAGHVLFLESHLQFLPAPSKNLRWIGTIHLPRKCWNLDGLERLRALPEVLVLCDSMREQFGDVLDASQLKVIPYGVDTSFFKPGPGYIEPPRQTLLYVGAWLRNTAMLARLVPEISRRFPQVVFDFVVPLHARDDEWLRTLGDNPSIRWHQGLSDESLRDLYQNATALLLPMEDGGANNAVVEALACGLPIITTDVGGIRSYGGGALFPLVANNDDSSCMELVAAYLTDRDFAASVSTGCRKFAETKLEWTIAAKEYIRVYRELGLF
jgi:glycosyltransferase involved in cell wall biosynthesis